MVTGGRTLIGIGYQYNAWKVLSFIIIDIAGSTHAGLIYLCKYPEQLTNVSIRLVSLPLVMTKHNLLLMRFTTTTNQGSMI